MKSKIFSTCLIALVFPIGCIDADSIDSISEAALIDEPEFEIQPFAEVEVEPGHLVSFYATSPDDTSVAVTEIVPFGSQALLATARSAGATSLELYLAIAPDTPVPAELEAAHMDEVQERGRIATGAQPLSIAPIPLHNDPPCTSEATFDTWFGTMSGKDANIKSYWLASGGPTTYTWGEFSTTYRQFYGGGCNLDAGAKDFRWCYTVPATGGIAPPPVCSRFTSVAVGSTWYSEQYNSTPKIWYTQVRYPYLVSGTARLVFHVEG